MADDGWLTTEVVTAVTAHMNGDHADDNVVICRAAGGHPDVTAARLTGMDLEAFEFTAVEPTGEVVIRVPFSQPLEGRAQIREEAARMYHGSAAALGLPARDH